MTVEHVQVRSPVNDQISLVDLLDRLLGTGVVLTGRSEGFVVGRPDLDETIRRLPAYAEAGADFLYLPHRNRRTGQGDCRRRVTQAGQSSDQRAVHDGHGGAHKCKHCCPSTGPTAVGSGSVAATGSGPVMPWFGIGLTSLPASHHHIAVMSDHGGSNLVVTPPDDGGGTSKPVVTQAAPTRKAGHGTSTGRRSPSRPMTAGRRHRCGQADRGPATAVTAWVSIDDEWKT